MLTRMADGNKIFSVAVMGYIPFVITSATSI